MYAISHLEWYGKRKYKSVQFNFDIRFLSQWSTHRILTNPFGSDMAETGFINPFHRAKTQKWNLILLLKVKKKNHVLEESENFLRIAGQKLMQNACCFH